MTNTDLTASDAAARHAMESAHPWLSKACPVCKSAPGDHCVVGVDVSRAARTADLDLGPGAYRKQYVTINEGLRSEYNIAVERRVPGPATRKVHVRRLPAVRVSKAESLPGGAKVAERALAEADMAERALKCPVWVTIVYEAMSGEYLAFQAGPMSAAMAQRVGTEACQTECNVVRCVDFYVQGEEDATAERVRGTAKRGHRLVTLPSQVACGVERMADAVEVTEPVEMPRLTGRSVQADWLDALAV